PHGLVRVPLNRNTSLPGSVTGNGRSRAAFTTLKIDVFAPIPRASERTATAAKPGLALKTRKPYRRSCIRVSILPLNSVWSAESGVRSQESEIRSQEIELPTPHSRLRTPDSALRTPHFLQSFVSQRDHRICSRRAARGHETSRERHNQYRQADRDKRCWICRTHVKQQSRHQPSQPESTDQSRGHSDHRDQHTLLHNQLLNVAWFGAERDSYSDFVRALRYRISHHAVDSDRRQQHRKHGE